MIMLKRLFCLLLALAMLSATAALSADSGAQVTVFEVQRLAAGTAFDPDTAPEAANAAPGDIVVLTFGLRNASAKALDITGFAAKILFDKTKVTPYTGTAPFTKKNYQTSKLFSEDYDWAVNMGFSKDNYVMFTGVGTNPCSVGPGSTLVLGRAAFQVNADASGAAEFTFDVAEQKTSIIDARNNALTPDVSPFRLTLGGYSISSVASDRVTLSNPAPVTLVVSRFDAAGKFLGAETQLVPANAGTVSLTTAAAPKIRAALMDSECRPLCVYG